MTQEVFHVVCHDCAAESLHDSELDANNVAASHMTSSAHRVSVGRVE